MNQPFVPITDAELKAAGFCHRSGSTANRVIEGVERDPERVVVYSVRAKDRVPFLLFRRGVWQLPTTEALTHVRTWLSVPGSTEKQPAPLHPHLVPRPIKGTELEALSLVTVRRLVPGLIGKLFNPVTPVQLLERYDQYRKTGA